LAAFFSRTKDNRIKDLTGRELIGAIIIVSALTFLVVAISGLLLLLQPF
jgi:hypothetical protein